MQVGVDFKSYFSEDNYVVRHITGHNMFDPESFISGSELAKGLNYKNSHRDWKSEQDYFDAVTGKYSPEEILVIAPRVRNAGQEVTL